VSWLGDILGAWIGRWLGDNEPAAPGAMSMSSGGAGTLAGTLAADGAGSMAATLTGYGSFTAALEATSSALPATSGGLAIRLPDPIMANMAMRAMGSGTMRASAIATVAGSVRIAAIGRLYARPTLAASLDVRTRGSASMAGSVRPALRLSARPHGSGRGAFAAVRRRNINDEDELIALILAIDHDRRKAA